MEPSLDFISALGEEFCTALCPPVPWELMVPQDAYEIWLRAFGQPPGPEDLAALSDLEVSRLRDECEKYLECPDISVEQVRSAVDRTRLRWPAASV